MFSGLITCQAASAASDLTALAQNQDAADKVEKAKEETEDALSKVVVLLWFIRMLWESCVL